MPISPAKRIGATIALILFFGVVVVLPLWIGWRVLQARQTATAMATPIATPAPAWSSDTDCRAPLKPGETLQIVFRHDGGAITFRCQSYTDWHLLRPLTRPQGGTQ